jgi:hypothetical protein
MKTGLIGDTTPIGQETKKLIAIVVTMVAESQKTAMLYCEHQKRSLVTIKDIDRGLCYQARNFLFADETEQNVQKMEDILFNEEGDDEDDEEEEEDGDDDDQWDDVEEDETICQCEICLKVRQCHDSWDDWQPEDKVGQFIKNALDKAKAGIV